MMIGSRVRVKAVRPVRKDLHGKEGVVISIYGEVAPFMYLVAIGDEMLALKGDEITLCEVEP